MRSFSLFFFYFFFLFSANSQTHKVIVGEIMYKGNRVIEPVKIRVRCTSGNTNEPTGDRVPKFLTVTNGEFSIETNFKLKSNCSCNVSITSKNYFSAPQDILFGSKDVSRRLVFDVNKTSKAVDSLRVLRMKENVANAQTLLNIKKERYTRSGLKRSKSKESLQIRNDIDQDSSELNTIKEQLKIVTNNTVSKEEFEEEKDKLNKEITRLLIKLNKDLSEIEGKLDAAILAAKLNTYQTVCGCLEYSNNNIRLSINQRTTELNEDKFYQSGGDALNHFINYKVVLLKRDDENKPLEIIKTEYNRDTFYLQNYFDQNPITIELKTRDEVFKSGKKSGFQILFYNKNNILTMAKPFEIFSLKKQCNKSNIANVDFRSEIIKNEFVDIEGDSVKVTYVDNQKYDRDSFSLLLNDKFYWRKLEVPEQPITKMLPLEIGENKIVIRAESIGDTPPCTILISFISKTGGNQKTIIFESNFLKSEGIIIRRIK